MLIGRGVYKARLRVRPCAAAPGTSRPCRAGAARAGRCGPSPRSVTAGRSSAAHPPRPTSSRPRQHGVDHATGLLEVGRAGDVRDHAARPRRVERRVEQLALQRHERRRRRPAYDASATRDDGAARRGRVQGASTITRSNVPGRHDGSVPSPHDHSRGRPVATQRRLRTRSARCGSRSCATSTRAALAGQAGEQRRLAARAGAQVEPPLVATVDAAPRPAPAPPAGSPRPAPPPARSRTSGIAPGSPPGEHTGVRRPTARRDCRRPARRHGQPGAPTSVTRGGTLSAASSSLEPPSSPEQRRRNASTTHRGCECRTARCPTRSVDRGRARPRPATRRAAAPPTRRSTALTIRTGRSPDVGPDQLDRGADRGVGRAPAC